MPTENRYEDLTGNFLAALSNSSMGQGPTFETNRPAHSLAPPGSEGYVKFDDAAAVNEPLPIEGPPSVKGAPLRPGEHAVGAAGGLYRPRGPVFKTDTPAAPPWAKNPSGVVK